MKASLPYRKLYKRALRWRWLRTYLTCAYCGKLISWKWKWCKDFDKHRMISGACQCESIGGHPRVVEIPEQWTADAML